MYHQAMKFTTFDKDQDIAATNCAVDRKGAFWHYHCGDTNLNGIYGDKDNGGSQYVTWNDFRGWDALKWVEMKFRPNY